MPQISRISDRKVEVSDDESPATTVAFKRVDERTYAVVYDERNGSIVWSMVDYSIFLSGPRLRCERSTVEGALLAIAAYRNFLDRHARINDLDTPYDFHESTDELLAEFREAEFERVFSRANSNHEEFAAKRTVNLKLVHIYQFLNWYKYSTGRLEFFGGEHGPVASTLSESDVQSRKATTGGESGDSRYPLLYKRVGAGSRLGRGYTANDDDKAALRDYFQRNFTSYVGLRNILLMEVADRVGWRRGSINSLRCDQFNEDALGRMSSRGLWCVPDRQKRGYKDGFYVPPDLANQIASFIHDTRETLVDEMGWSALSKSGPVFMSARDGGALTDKTLSKIFGKAFAAIGAPKRAGLHSFRRKFTDDSIGAETRARIALGLDTSAESVSAAVSADLGQHNPESIRPYISSNQTRLASRKRNP
ncbi:hypothetical protein [Paraburkholderia diazotrophica]|uniref:hypothetical protein n=1 Tax=Paraburkholderia diazotrophica TaxID=667676 RepID=UPI00317AE35D